MEMQQIIEEIETRHWSNIKFNINKGRHFYARLEAGFLNDGLILPNASELLKYNKGDSLIVAAALLEDALARLDPKGEEFQGKVNYFKNSLNGLKMAYVEKDMKDHPLNE